MITFATFPLTLQSLFDTPTERQLALTQRKELHGKFVLTADNHSSTNLVLGRERVSRAESCQRRGPLP